MPENPKQRMKRELRGSTTDAFGDVSNPIAQELRDLERYLNHNFSLYPTVPFFGEGDATLYFFQKLRTLSSTHQGIIGSIRDFVLGGEFEVRRKANKRIGFNRREELEVPVTAQEFINYIDWLESIGIDGSMLMEVAEGLYDNLKSYGNAYLEITWSDTDGQTFGQFHSHDVDQVRYLATEEGEKVLVISPLWEEDYLRRNPPDFIPVFPAFMEDELGVKRSIIHIKNKVSGFNWYGLPDWIGMLYYGYQEIQLGEYTTAGYANQWTPKVLLEYEDMGDYEEDGSEDLNYAERDLDFEDAMVQTLTNKGKEKKGLVIRARPAGSQPTDIHEFDIKTGENFHKTIAEIAEGNIFKAHNWHPMLMISTSGKLGLSQELEQLIKFKQETVIRRLQNALLMALNMGVDFLNEQVGMNEEMFQYRLGLSHIFTEILKKEAEAEADEGGQPSGDPSEDEPEVEPQENDQEDE